ncbi:MAG: hypothetical protein HUU37_05920 [Bdellovibrionales bacterium]|nr:hypothetical protein [Bdellovibrionales bacterium]
MSAYLDRSQGFTFVFSNIYEIYRKAKDSKLDDPLVVERIKKADPSARQRSGRVIKAGTPEAESARKLSELSELRPENGERSFPVPMGVREAEEKAMRQNMKPISHLKENLGKIEDAHAKLRYLLSELEDLTKKK